MKITIIKEDYSAPVASVIESTPFIPLCTSGIDNADGVEDYQHEEW